MRKLSLVLLALAVAGLNMRLLLADVQQSGASRTSGSAGVGVGGTNVWTGSNTFTDSLFTLSDDATPTKLAQFQLSGLSVGTRTFTLPDASGTFFCSNCGNTFSVNSSLANAVELGLGAVNNANNAFQWNTVQTPDTGMLNTGSTGNSWLVAERADIAFDFAVAQQTDPTLVIASHNQSTQERGGFRHNATQFQVQDFANTASSRRPIGLMGGSAVASAGTITPTGNVFHITGTTGITAITAMGAGTCITMIFDGVVTVTDSATLNIGAAFASTADDTLTMCSDGTNWYEIGRSIN